MTRKEINTFVINWITKRGLSVLDFQVDILVNQLQDAFEDNKEVVLASAVGSGKTMMSICFIDLYLTLNPGHKVLVLTHGTTVLRTQYYNAILDYTPDFTTSVITDASAIKLAMDSDVVVTLPQSIFKHKLPKFNLLVVDEAHEYYMPKSEAFGMVDSIKKAVNHDFELLLTGTPSLFVKKGFKVIFTSLQDLMEAGMVSKHRIELAVSTYDFTGSDYDRDEVNRVFDPYQTDTTLDEVLRRIEMRLIADVRTNSNHDWSLTFKDMSKTMIACRTQAQAEQVSNYFNNKGVKNYLSISDLGDASDMELFRNSTDVKLLIVCRRGILGYNDTKLYNIIDMTCSRNLNRTFQLLGRITRKDNTNPDKEKLFIKVTPFALDTQFKYMMTGVISMYQKDFFMKFDGTNFRQLNIPIKHTGKKVVRRPKK